MDTTSVDVRAANAVAVPVPARPQRTTSGRLIRRLFAVAGLAFGMWLLALLLGTTSASAHTARQHHAAHRVTSASTATHTGHASLLAGLTRPVGGLVTHVVRHTQHALTKADHRSSATNANGGAASDSDQGSSTSTSKSPAEAPDQTPNLLSGVVHLATGVTHGLVTDTSQVINQLTTEVVRPLVQDAVSTVTQPRQTVTGIARSIPPTTPVTVGRVADHGTSASPVVARPAQHARAERITRPAAHVSGRPASSVQPTSAANLGPQTRHATPCPSHRTVSPTAPTVPTLPTAPYPPGPGSGDQGSTTTGSGGSAGSQSATSAQGIPVPRGTDGGRRRLPSTVGLVGVSEPRPTFSPD